MSGAHGSGFSTSIYWRRALLAYFGVLAVIAFWPTPVDRPVQGLLAKTLNFLHRHHIPEWVDYKFVEGLGNVVLFLPVGFLAMMAFTNRSRWENVALGLMASAVMELGQWIFLPERYPSFKDLTLNTLGTALGVLVFQMQHRRMSSALP